jgi:hypothetical protein
MMAAWHEDRLGMTDITLNVGSFSALDAAIAEADADTTSGDAYTITFTGNITETADLTALNLASGVSVTINGASHTLNGQNNSGLFVYAGDVAVQNLTIQNAVATGGAGDEIAGGGAGLGGGLFVASAGTVTLSGVTFSHDEAVGGNGGIPYPHQGGGGGLGGAGGSLSSSLGGGGGVGATASGGTSGAGSGGTGIVRGAAAGGGAPGSDGNGGFYNVGAGGGGAHYSQTASPSLIGGTGGGVGEPERGAARLAAVPPSRRRGGCGSR